MGVEIIGLKEFNVSLDTFVGKNIKALDKILVSMAVDTKAISIQSIQQGGRSGRTYNRKGISHQASAAGEAPKTDKGNLVSNITFQKDGMLNYSAGSRRGAPYGAWLELGTRNISPRPWLSPAYKQVVKKYRSKFV